jgi:hypothetical protein
MKREPFHALIQRAGEVEADGAEAGDADGEGA